MDILTLENAILDGLESVKAHNIEVFDTQAITKLFDRVFIASGTSNRQTRALASSVREKVKEAGGEVVGTEGEGEGEWILVDCCDAVVHILLPTMRDYYKLEEIWGGTPVQIKHGAV